MNELKRHLWGIKITQLFCMRFFSLFSAKKNYPNILSHFISLFSLFFSPNFSVLSNPLSNYPPLSIYPSLSFSFFAAVFSFTSFSSPFIFFFSISHFQLVFSSCFFFLFCFPSFCCSIFFVHVLSFFFCLVYPTFSSFKSLHEICSGNSADGGSGQSISGHQNTSLRSSCPGS